MFRGPDWCEYKVDIRAEPDTPERELEAKRQGRVLGPQTVIYTLYANSPEEAVDRALAYERAELHRRNVWLMTVVKTGRKI